MRFSSAHFYLLTQMVPTSPPPPFGYVSVPGIVCGWSGGHSGNYFSLLHCTATSFTIWGCQCFGSSKIPKQTLIMCC